jgi:two-component system sensor histidine kinase YesM
MKVDMFKKVKDLPLKIKLLIFFLPVIILSVSTTGLFSYLSATSQLRENARYLLENTMLQTNMIINDKFTTIFGELVSLENNDAYMDMILNKYTGENDEKKYLDFIKMSGKLNDIYNTYFQVIDSIYFYCNNDREVMLFKDFVPTRISIDLDKCMEKYNWSDKGYYWANIHKDDVFSSVQDRNVISVFKLLGNKNSEAKAILLFNLKSNYFLDIINKIRVSSNGYVALISDDGILFSKDDREIYDIDGQVVEQLRENAGKSGSLNVDSANGKKLFIVYNSLSINNWVLAAVVPEKDITEKAEQIKYFSFAIIIVLVILSSFLTVLFTESISKSIRYLSEQVKKFEKGDFNVKFKLPYSSNEIGVLARGLGSLVGSVKELLEKVKAEQEKKRLKELLILQSQINPHFLYNTLGSIKHLIDMNENSKAGKMTAALTKFFMIGVNRGKEIISLREEIEHVNSYLFIQKMRYSKEFDFHINVDEEVLESKTMKLTLQPIVENSIYHGIKDKTALSQIMISGWKEENDVFIEVYDNGVGINPEKLDILMKSIKSDKIDDIPITYGLRNVNERLKLYFGEGYGINITSVEGEYTSVLMKLPYNK